MANNGLAAVKFMRSVRSWANHTFGTPHAVSPLAMATPDDIRINAEHIQLADVRLIVETARNAGVDAVWPGW